MPQQGADNAKNITIANIAVNKFYAYILSDQGGKYAFAHKDLTNTQAYAWDIRTS